MKKLAAASVLLLASCSGDVEHYDISIPENPSASIETMHPAEGYEWGIDSNDVFIAVFESDIVCPSFEEAVALADEAGYDGSGISAVACSLD